MHSSEWMKGTTNYHQVGQTSQVTHQLISDMTRIQNAEAASRYMQVSTGVSPQSVRLTGHSGAYFNGVASDWQTSTVPQLAVSSQQAATGGRDNFCSVFGSKALQSPFTNSQNGNYILPAKLICARQVVPQQSFQQKHTQSQSNQSSPNVTIQSQPLPGYGNQPAMRWDGNFVADLQHLQVQNLNVESAQSPSASAAGASTTAYNRQAAQNLNYSSGYRQINTQYGVTPAKPPPSYASVSQHWRNNSIAANSANGHCFSSMGHKTCNGGIEATNCSNFETTFFLSKTNQQPSTASICSAPCTGQHLLSQQRIQRIADGHCQSRTVGSDGHLQANSGKQFGTDGRMTDYRTGQPLPHTNHVTVQQNLENPPQQSSVPKGFVDTVTGDGGGNGFTTGDATILRNNSTHSCGYSTINAFSQLQQLCEGRSAGISSPSCVEVPEMVSVKPNDGSIHAFPGRSGQRAVNVVQPLSQELCQTATKHVTSEDINPLCKRIRKEEFVIMKEINHKNFASQAAHMKKTKKTVKKKIQSSDSAGFEHSSPKQSRAGDTASELSSNIQSVHCAEPAAPQSVTTSHPNASFEHSSIPTICWRVDKLTKLIEETSKAQRRSNDDKDNGNDFDVANKLLDMFWNGSCKNLASLLKTGWYKDLIIKVNEFCCKQQTTAPDTIILSQAQHRLLSQVNSFHIIKHDDVYQEEPYTSSWLNINEQLDDIDKEFGFPWSLKYCNQTVENDSQPEVIEKANDVPVQLVNDKQNVVLLQTQLEAAEPDNEKLKSGVVDTSAQPPSPTSGVVDTPIQTPSPTSGVVDTPIQTLSPTPGVVDTPIQTPSPTPGVVDTPIQTPSPTPGVVDTPIQTPSPTSGVVDTPIQTPSPTPGVVDTPIQTPSPTPGVVDTPIQTPSPTPGVVDTRIQTPSPTPGVVDTPIQTPSPTPGVVDTPIQSPSPTPGVVDTPIQSPSPTPGVVDTPIQTPSPTPGVVDTPIQTPSPNKMESTDFSDPHYSFKIQILPPEEAKLIYEQSKIPQSTKMEGQPDELIKIQVLPPEEAKLIYEQSKIPQSTKTENQSDKLMNGSVEDELPEILDVTFSEAILENRRASAIQQFCCINRWMEIISGSNNSLLCKCQCKQQKSLNDCTVKRLDHTEKPEEEEKMCVIQSECKLHHTSEDNKADETMIFSWAAECPTHKKILDLTEDDIPQSNDDMEPMNVSLLSIDGDKSSSIVISENHVENLFSSENTVAIPLSVLEGDCEQGQRKSAERSQSSSSDNGEKEIENEITSQMSDLEDRKQAQQKSTDMSQSSSSTSFDLEFSSSERGTQTSDIEDRKQAQQKSTDMSQSSSSSSFDLEFSSSERGTQTSDIEDRKQAQQKSTDMSQSSSSSSFDLEFSSSEHGTQTSDIEDRKQAQQKSTDMSQSSSSSSFDLEFSSSERGTQTSAQVDLTSADSAVTTLKTEQRETPVSQRDDTFESNRTSSETCKVSHIVSSPSEQGNIHSSAFKKALGPNGKCQSVGIKQRLSSPDGFFPSDKNLRKLKSSDVPDSQLALKDSSNSRKVVAHPDKVRSVELSLFGSGPLKKQILISGHGSHMSLQKTYPTNQALTPPETLTVLLGPLRRSPPETILKREYSVKQLIHEKWRRSIPPTILTYTRKCLKRKSKYEIGLKKVDTVGPVSFEKRKWKANVERKETKRSRSLHKRKSISNGSKHGEQVMKKDATVKQSDDKEGSHTENGNNDVLPLQENIVLRFSVLPNTFNFKDEAIKRHENKDKSELLEAKDKSSNTDVKTTTTGAWTQNPEKKYRPVQSPVKKNSVLFDEFRKKYKQKAQPVTDD